MYVRAINVMTIIIVTFFRILSFFKKYWSISISNSDYEYMIVHYWILLTVSSPFIFCNLRMWPTVVITEALSLWWSRSHHRFHPLLFLHGSFGRWWCSPSCCLPRSVSAWLHRQVFTHIIHDGWWMNRVKSKTSEANR